MLMRKKHNITGLVKYLPVSSRLQFPSSQIRCLFQSLSPFPSSLFFFKFGKGFCHCPPLIADFRRFHVIEDGVSSMFGSFVALNYLNKLIQAPRGRGIIFGENNDLITNIFALFYSLVVLVCMNAFLLKSIIKMINEVGTSVFAPKTQKHIILEALVNG
ncbi:hypothetical protein LXL04_007145 [Taraxacum kok-saghyz]